MNPSYKLTKKSQAAREAARTILCPTDVDRIVRKHAADKNTPFLFWFSQTQRKSFEDFMDSFPPSIRHHTSIAKFFFIFADFRDCYRTK